MSLLYWVSNCPGNMPKYYPGNMPKYYSTKYHYRNFSARSILIYIVQTFYLGEIWKLLIILKMSILFIPIEKLFLHFTLLNSRRQQTRLKENTNNAVYFQNGVATLQVYSI